MVNKTKISVKEYTVKEGQEDWKVWSRATDWLSEFMFRKRRTRFRTRKLRKPITIKIIIKEH